MPKSRSHLLERELTELHALLEEVIEKRVWYKFVHGGKVIRVWSNEGKLANIVFNSQGSLKSQVYVRIELYKAGIELKAWFQLVFLGYYVKFKDINPNSI